MTSRLSATAGVRYTHEGKDIDNAGGRYVLEDPNLPIPGSVYGYSDSIAHDAWTPKVGLEMKLPHGALAYVSATRGFKSGGFNLSSTAPGRGYAPEWAWSYEGGLKGTLMGGRSRFSTSAFVMDYTNLQVQTPIGIGVLDIRNAAAATIRGVEVENTSRIGRGIEAGGHLAWLDATYDRYIAVAVDRSTGDVSGNRLNNAPEWAGRLWIEWTGDIGRSRRLSLSAESTAQSTVFFTPFNDSIQRQSPYGLLGARVEYGPAIAGGRSALTPETSRTRITSRERSARRPTPLPDVLDLRVSSLLISPYGDRNVALNNPSSSAHTLYWRRRPCPVRDCLLWRIEPQRQLESRVFGRGQPVGLLVLAGRVALDVQRQSAVGIPGQMTAVAERVAVDRVGDEIGIVVVHRQRPERVDRRDLGLLEMEGVLVRAVERLAVAV